MRQNRRRKNRQNTGRARRCWKGMLAVIAAAATFLTGIDVTGLQTVFANGTSGYKIEVSYSEDQSQATLTGNADRLGQGVTLVSVTDAEGKEYSPSEFSYPVTENGDYTFTVDYKVEEAALIREEKEELTVTVDGIKKIEIEDTPSESTEPSERMAVSELLARAQNTEGQITPLEIPVYTSESNLRLGSAAISYSGGKFSEELTGELGNYPGRFFDYAYFVLPGDDTEFPLLGLYPLYNEQTQKTDWYYILEDKGATGSQNPGTGGVEGQVAIELPEDAQVRVKYKVTTDPKNIAKKYIKPEGGADTNAESIKRWDTSLVEKGRAGEKIVVTFTVPAEYTSAIVEIAGAGGTNIKTFDTANAKNTGLEENVGGVDGRYSGIFDMIDQAVTVTFKAQIAGDTNYKDFGFAWPRSEDKDSGNYQIEAGRTYASINTDSNGKAEYKISYLTDFNSSSTTVRLYEDQNYRPSGTVKNIPLYNAEDVVKGRRIAQGKYKTGETQTINIQYEMGSYSDNSDNRYTYIPTVLDFYVYKGVAFGENPSNSNVLLEQISLPQSKNGTITQQLESGGTVKITLTEQKNRTPNEQVADSDFGTDKWGDPYDKYFDGGRNYSHPYWEYEIKVSGTRYPYVVSLLDDSGAQEGFVVKEMKGVELGKAKADGSGDSEYSTYFQNRGNSGRKEYSLRLGSVLWELYMADTHPTTKRPATMLHLVPKMGYGWPTITLGNTAPGQQSGRDITPHKTPNGKTYYTHYISSAESGGDYRKVVTEISIAAEPITLNVKYAANGGSENSPSSGKASLTPSSDRHYAVVLQDNLVPQGKYMNGYTLTIKNNKGRAITIDNPDDPNKKWYPGDILDVEDLYWQMASATANGDGFLLQGQGQPTNTYTMTFTADISNTPVEGSYGNVEYKIRTQENYNDWSGDPNSADHETMYGTGFTSRTDSVMAYYGSKVLMRNYPDKPEGRPTRIISKYSTTEMTLKPNGGEQLDLVYLLGAQVEFTGLGSNASNSNLIQKPGNSGTYVYAEETWFTGMDKHDNEIDLSSIDPGDPAADKVFAGWKITNTGGDAYNNGNPINDNLDLYAMGKTNKTLWDQIFKTDGVIKLEAQWADAMQRITLPGGSMSGSQEVKLYQSPYSISATFNMASAVSTGSTVDFAIYISRPNGAWGIAEIGRVDLATETITRPPTNKTANRFFENLKDASFDVNVQKGAASTDITLNVSGITDLTGNRKTYRIYMWNSKNGNANLWNNGNLGDIISYIYRDNLNAFTSVADYPYMDLTLRQIPKVFTEDSTQVTESKKDKLFYEGQSFTVSGTFSLEKDQKDTFDQIHTDNTSTEIKVALYKVDPPGTTGNYDIWSINSGPVTKHSGKVSAPTITKVSDTKFTVSFTITDSSGSISNQWDDGAKYRVFAWTDSNGNVDGNPDFGQERDAFPVNDTITTIPSTTTTMAGVLGQQVESIIHYPKQITMLDNVVPNNKHIFSGNEKITIQPTLNDGRSAEIPDSDIGVDVVIRELLNGNQTFNITRGTETIPLKGFIGTVGNGTGIPNTGKLGTLKFDPNDTGTQDMLEFYFRSENPPTVADGAAFEGTIHFQFSKGSGTTN